VLSVEGLTRHFERDDRQVTAADGVSFEVPSGAVVGLVGPDGAGKSTVLRSAAGLVTPTAGTVTVDGVDVTDAPSRAARTVAMLFAGERNTYPELTPRENLAFFAGLQGIDARERQGVHADLLSTLGLSGVADVPVADLSRGQRRRVALGCTLARETPVLLLDEPTAGLDVAASYDVRGRIRRLAAERNRTVLLASHDVEAVQETCDRVVVLARGEVVVDESVEQLVGPSRARAYRVTLASAPDAEARRHIEVDHGIERWVDIPEGVRFEVTIDDTTAFYDLVASLRETGADVVSVSAVDPSLEDAFLDLGGGGR